jgi:predicted DNA-binding protein
MTLLGHERRLPMAEDEKELTIAELREISELQEIYTTFKLRLTRTIYHKLRYLSAYNGVTSSTFLCNVIEEIYDANYGAIIKDIENLKPKEKTDDSGPET